MVLIGERISWLAIYLVFSQFCGVDQLEESHEDVVSRRELDGTGFPHMIVRIVPIISVVSNTGRSYGYTTRMIANDPDDWEDLDGLDRIEWTPLKSKKRIIQLQKCSHQNLSSVTPIESVLPVKFIIITRLMIIVAFEDSRIDEITGRRQSWITKLIRNKLWHTRSNDVIVKIMVNSIQLWIPLLQFLAGFSW